MFMTKERQASPFKVGLPHYVEFHGDIPLRFSKNRRGGNRRDPQGETPLPRRGREGVIKTPATLPKVSIQIKGTNGNWHSRANKHPYIDGPWPSRKHL
jgi:hypothetical protein